MRLLVSIAQEIAIPTLIIALVAVGVIAVKFILEVGLPWIF